MKSALQNKSKHGQNIIFHPGYGWIRNQQMVHNNADPSQQMMKINADPEPAKNADELTDDDNQCQYWIDAVLGTNDDLRVMINTEGRLS
jgi:hypothetical protein